MYYLKASALIVSMVKVSSCYIEYRNERWNLQVCKPSNQRKYIPVISQPAAQICISRFPVSLKYYSLYCQPRYQRNNKLTEKCVIKTK